MAYWKTNEKTFSVLSVMAKVYLAILATRTLSQRVYSKTQAIVGLPRSGLRAESVEHPLYLEDRFQVLGPFRTLISRII